MKIINIVVLALSLSLIYGCASVTSDIKVDTKTSSTTNLNGYKTYAWLGAGAFLNDPDSKWQPSELNITGDIKFLINRELRKHKLYSSASNPDLAVVYFMGVDMDKMKLNKDPNTKVEMLKNVPAAALVVALIDAKTKNVVWIGFATAEVQDNPSNEVVQERLDYAVTEMMKEMPRD